MNQMNIDEYRDKVLGCWMGKNIGGTLGAPMEGKTEIQNVNFYQQDLKGSPAPNDDLDLQLVWFQAIKQYGIERVDSKVLAEYWVSVVNGPWNEYGVGRTNLKLGLPPPLSGSCNNDRWKFSNGAWIRSEIWACSFPGQADRAIEYAYRDACVDHTGEGIYAEMFTAALEAAAFVVKDTRRLIEIGLSKIPPDCRTARCVKVALEAHQTKKDWKAAREAVLQSSRDLGWFQAPANIGFTVIGLLYGEGDFGKTICIAVNCGDDTDCTGATAGAVWGIQYGAKAIPPKWMEPIGDGIVNVCITPFMVGPKTLTDLAKQVSDETIYQGASFLRRAKDRTGAEPLVELVAGPTAIKADLLEKLMDPASAKEIWARSPYAIHFNLPHVSVVVDYEGGPQITSGKEKNISVIVNPNSELCVYEKVISLKWRLPEGWAMNPGPRAQVFLGTPFAPDEPATKFVLTPGPMASGMTFLELEITEQGRLCPTVIAVPLQDSQTVRFVQRKAHEIPAG